MSSSVFFSLLLLLSLVSLVVSTPPAVDWSVRPLLNQAIRGMSCAAPRVYPYNSNTYWMVMYNGEANSQYNTISYKSTGYFTWQWNNYPTVNTSGREGGYLHYQVTSSSTFVGFNGGGRLTDKTGNVVAQLWQSSPATGNQWTQMANPAGGLTPLAYQAWNYSYTPVVDTLWDDSYVTVITGGWVVIPGVTPTQFVDNNFYVIESNPAAVDVMTVGIPTPFLTPRIGVAMASFNGSAAYPNIRGTFVVIGGLEYPNDVYHNDVWIANTPRTNGSWINFGNAPFSPRYAAQAFDGGRLGIFIYGGLDRSHNVLNDLWYGQFGGMNNMPYSSSNVPTWVTVPITNTYTGPNIIPGCSMAYWFDDATLYLFMVGSHTDTPYNATLAPTTAAWAGKITYPPATSIPPPPQGSQ